MDHPPGGWDWLHRIRGAPPPHEQRFPSPPRTPPEKRIEVIDFHINWELLEFVRAGYVTKENLGELVTVSGWFERARMERVHEVLGRSGTGRQTFELMRDLIGMIMERIEGNGVDKEPILEISKTFSEGVSIVLKQHYSPDKSHATAQVCGPFRAAWDTVGHLEWLTTVLRPCKPNTLLVSDLHIKNVWEPNHQVTIFPKFPPDLRYLRPKPKPEPEREGQGWTSLMKTGNFAWSSHPVQTIEKDEICRRPEGFWGLAISFQDMKELAKVENSILFKGRIALEGEDSLLVPVKFEDGAILWKYFCGKDRLEKAGEIVNDSDEAFTGLDLDQLPKFRNFLG